MKTDETIERLCEVYIREHSVLCRFPELSEDAKCTIRASIRAVYEAVLADLRPMPDRLEVANVLLEAAHTDAIGWDDWSDLPQNWKRETEAMLELFTGRTQSEMDSEIERLERLNEQLQEDVAELRRDKESLLGAYTRLDAELAEAQREIEKVRAELAATEPTECTTPELTDDEEERLAEGLCDAAGARWHLSKTTYTRLARYALTNIPRLPYRPREGVTLDGLQTVIDQNKYGWQGAFVLDYLGITLPTAPTITLDGPQTAEQLRAAADALEANA